jgi:hypothetical protein
MSSTLLVDNSFWSTLPNVFVKLLNFDRHNFKNIQFRFTRYMLQVRFNDLKF